jgi:hypothetical protein
MQGTGFSQYSWSNNITTQANSVSPTTTTNYSVTVTNAAGCTGSAQVTVTVNNPPNAGNNNSANVCNSTTGGGTTTINLNSLIIGGSMGGAFTPIGGAPSLTGGNTFNGNGLPERPYLPIQLYCIRRNIAMSCNRCSHFHHYRD